MRAALPLLVFVSLLAAGCGGSNTSASGDSTPASTASTAKTTTTPSTIPLELFYLADDGKLVAQRGEVPSTQALASAALHELATAPPGTTTSVPDALSVAITKGDAKVIGATLTKSALAQIVYTLTEFPTVQTVNGETRADVEDFVPLILVEHPTPDEEVSSPLHATGNANTYEATVEYELKDADGRVIAKGFTTATSGSGTRGTFDFTVTFKVDVAQAGELVVYETSAENGSRIHERAIPVRLSPQ